MHSSKSNILKKQVDLKQCDGLLPKPYKNKWRLCMSFCLATIHFNGTCPGFFSMFCVFHAYSETCDSPSIHCSASTFSGLRRKSTNGDTFMNFPPLREVSSKGITDALGRSDFHWREMDVEGMRKNLTSLRLWPLLTLWIWKQKSARRQDALQPHKHRLRGTLFKN